MGRKLAYPLPVPSLSIPEVVVPGIANYPWSIWMLWALEERMLCLGWAAEWFHDPIAARAAKADLQALARWPEYRQLPIPDLASAHAGRILCNAVNHWRWPDESLRRSLREACRRHAESVLGASDKFWVAVQDKNDILGRQAPHELLPNIPVIGTTVAAMTAAIAGHPAAARLGARARILFEATLDLRARGFTEAVAYDGYVLDFVADWLGTLPAGDRAAIVAHPRFEEYLEQSYMLGTTGSGGKPGGTVRTSSRADALPPLGPGQAALDSPRPGAELALGAIFPGSCCGATPWRPCTAPQEPRLPRRLAPAPSMPITRRCSAAAGMPRTWPWPSPAALRPWATFNPTAERSCSARGDTG